MHMWVFIVAFLYALLGAWRRIQQERDRGEQEFCEPPRSIGEIGEIVILLFPMVALWAVVFVLPGILLDIFSFDGGGGLLVMLLPTIAYFLGKFSPEISSLRYIRRNLQQAWKSLNKPLW